jgi:hypothetical protein
MASKKSSTVGWINHQLGSADNHPLAKLQALLHSVLLSYFTAPKLERVSSQEQPLPVPASAPSPASVPVTTATTANVPVPEEQVSGSSSALKEVQQRVPESGVVEQKEEIGM